MYSLFNLMTVMNVIHCYYLISLFFYIFLSSEARVFFVPDNAEQILAEGNAINITCVYQGDTIPSEEVKIKRNGKDLTGFEFTQRGSTSAPWNKTTTGFKANASCEDEGDYTCSFGEVEKKHQNISVIRVKHFNANLSHSGKDAVLKCEPWGCSGANNFTTEVSWSRDGKSLMADEKYNIIQSGSLVIKKADYSDLGPYQCKIILYHGGEEKNKLIFPILNVDLTGQPQVTIEGNKNIYVCENHPVRVLCKTEGYPKPDVMWHARLENASEGTPHLPEGNQLTIETFKSIHEGNYTCVANSSMFPQVEAKDSVRILLDGKGSCGPITEGKNLVVIIGVAAGATVVILVIIVGVIVYRKREGLHKHSDEKPESSPTDNDTDNLKDVQLQQRASNSQYSSANEPLLPDSTTNGSSVTTPPPKPPRTFSFTKQ